MVAGVVSLRSAYRRVLTGVVTPSQPLLPRLASRPFTTIPPRFALATRTARSEEPESPEWSQTTEPVRLVPVSPSYFTGNAEFVDNWLHLEALVRQYQLLPTVKPENAPHVRWKTLAQYSGIVGRKIKATKYKRLLNTLDRLNLIDPSLRPQEVEDAMEPYKREIVEAKTQGTPRELLNEKAYGLGRRKTSIAKVWVLEGDGQVLVNGKTLPEVFERQHDRESAVWPLISTGRMDKYNVFAIVKGGGKTGQAEAMTLGIGRALLVHEPALKPALRRGESNDTDDGYVGFADWYYSWCSYPRPQNGGEEEARSRQGSQDAYLGQALREAVVRFGLWWHWWRAACVSYLQKLVRRFKVHVRRCRDVEIE